VFAINLSGSSIGDERFLDFVREQFSHFAVRPQSICFEITETAAIAKLDKATYFINQLKSLGCLFSLDDFGSGMSSFAYLKHLPVDFLKIDGGFVKDMADDPIDRAMVEAINSVGHVMGKQTIAEFVDGERVIRLLREMGVDFAQGYGVAKPRPFGPRLRIAATG
jgi:EAL domain-containing protein (putative c-di-GMP-specific phosphodiesterase class I)